MENQTQNNGTNENDEKAVKKVKSLVKRNRAAALGLAVFFATSTTLIGCAHKTAEKNPNSALVEEQEEEEEDVYIGGSSGSGGYYYRSGTPLSGTNGIFSWGNSSNNSTWGDSSTTKSFSGYSASRGGSIGG